MTDITLDSLLQRLQNRLQAAPATRDDPWRTPGLATVDAAGLPSVRTVVLRSFENNCLEFHTDVRSAKWAALNQNPQAAWCFWDPKTKEQLRIQGNCTLHHQDELTEQIWNTLPSHTQASYGTSAAPSASIESPDAFAFIADIQRDNFGVIRCVAQTMDWLQLGRPKHHRALFKWHAQWQGDWIAP